MRTIIFAIFRAVVIVIVFGSIGIQSNVLSSKPIEWIYVPVQEMVLAGVKAPVTDAKDARRFLSDSGTIFVGVEGHTRSNTWRNHKA